MKSSGVGAVQYLFTLQLIIIISWDVAFQSIQAVIGETLCIYNVIRFP